MISYEAANLAVLEQLSFDWHSQKRKAQKISSIRKPPSVRDDFSIGPLRQRRAIHECSSTHQLVSQGVVVVQTRRHLSASPPLLTLRCYGPDKSLRFLAGPLAESPLAPMSQGGD